VSLVDISQEIKKFFILIFDFEHYIPMYVLRATKGRYSTKFRQDSLKTERLETDGQTDGH